MTWHVRTFFTGIELDPVRCPQERTQQPGFTIPHLLNLASAYAAYGGALRASGNGRLIEVTPKIVMGTPVITVRDYLAAQHIWTARREAWLCRKCEDKLVADRDGDLDRRHRSHAITAVLSAVAFLEGVVNASWKDAADNKTTAYTDGIPAQALTEMGLSWGGTRRYARKPLLDRFKLALKLADRPRMPNDDTYQSVDALIELRDHLVHFKPMSHRIGTDSDLERKLKPRFKENQQPIGSPWLPNKALGAGAAEWACESSIGFAREWHKRIGLSADFDVVYMLAEDTRSLEVPVGTTQETRRCVQPGLHPYWAAPGLRAYASRFGCAASVSELTFLVSPISLQT